jgi:predicted metal-dependent phosphoesterase TrpH
MKCDLHIHTNCSDGKFSPEDVVGLAKNAKLNCIAITDHDTTGGILRAQAAAAALDTPLQVLSGVEISTVESGKEIHILAYNMDMTSPEFAIEMDKIAAMRDNRNKALVEKLATAGILIDLDALTAAKNGSIGRPDIAAEMVKQGYCEGITQAFDQYIGKGKPYYVQTKRLTPTEAIAFIKKYGGISVLAHPRNLHFSYSRFDAYIKTLISVGLDGIEAEYFSHTKSERRFYCRIAKKYGLVITGGSDFHDYTHGTTIGKRHFSPSTFTKRTLNIK